MLHLPSLSFCFLSNHSSVFYYHAPSFVPFLSPHSSLPLSPFTMLASFLLPPFQTPSHQLSFPHSSPPPTPFARLFSSLHPFSQAISYSYLTHRKSSYFMFGLLSIASFILSFTLQSLAYFCPSVNIDLFVPNIFLEQMVSSRDFLPR